MKTAMQEFIENHFYINAEGQYEAKYTEDTIWTEYINETLEKEKEQIIDAHTNAYLIGEDDISVEDANEASIKYYNQNYNQNK
jgi:hypothetical protein